MFRHFHWNSYEYTEDNNTNIGLIVEFDCNLFGRMPAAVDFGTRQALVRPPFNVLTHFVFTNIYVALVCQVCTNF